MSDAIKAVFPAKPAWAQSRDLSVRPESSRLALGPGSAGFALVRDDKIGFGGR